MSFRFNRPVVITGLALLMVGASAAAALAVGSGSGTVSLPTLASPVTQDFNTLTNTPNAVESAVLPTGWYISESGTSATVNDGNYQVGIGSSTTGDTYSFGILAGNTDRAFGHLASGSLTSTVGAQLTNNTGGTIYKLAIAYTCEQWRAGGRSDADVAAFEYSTNATSLTTGTWTAVTALDLAAPTIIGVGGAVDGNAAANRAAKSATIFLTLPDAGNVWIRWTDTNSPGSDDGLGVDDFSVTPDVAVGVSRFKAE